MEIDPIEQAESSSEHAGNPQHARLNTWVAITVALLATFMGICKVKDDNIVQAMQQAQADKLDHWNFYQARNIRQEIAQAELTQLSLARGAQPAAGAAPRTKTDSAIARIVPPYEWARIFLLAAVAHWCSCWRCSLGLFRHTGRRKSMRSLK